MATCGYVCPKCEGTGLLQTGEECDWCGTVTPAPNQVLTDLPKKVVSSED